jgi:hypothetical protein
MAKATQGINIVTQGGQNTFPAPSATLGAGATVKNGPGILCSVLVTTNLSAVITIFDNTAASGTIIGIVPATATVGQVFVFNMPANIGITTSAVANTGAVTISFV